MHLCTRHHTPIMVSPQCGWGCPHSRQPAPQAARGDRRAAAAGPGYRGLLQGRVRQPHIHAPALAGALAAHAESGARRPRPPIPAVRPGAAGVRLDLTPMPRSPTARSVLTQYDANELSSAQLNASAIGVPSAIATAISISVFVELNRSSPEPPQP